MHGYDYTLSHGYCCVRTCTTNTKFTETYLQIVVASRGRNLIAVPSGVAVALKAQYHGLRRNYHVVLRGNGSGKQFRVTCLVFLSQS
jgi:hypothetical protein